MPGSCMYVAIINIISFSVGGSLPIVTSYVSEFVTEKQRGPFLVVVSSFWLPGNVYTGICTTL